MYYHHNIIINVIVYEITITYVKFLLSEIMIYLKYIITIFFI